ncbi:MAG: flagellar hook-length control protein FliK [Desulfobacter sp.]|nr:MAG: flagellar hook-length control protein FliK [Desulfobacter sp.]
MNMHLVDMTNTMPNMVRAGEAKASVLGIDRLPAAGAGFDSVLKQVAQKGERNKISDPEASTDNGVIADKSGQVFLSDLETLLLKMSGGDLTKLTIDPQGLDALNELLIKAGFDPDEVADLIAGLKEKAGTKEISFDQVMAGLSDLEILPEENAEPEDVFLETSALPFIISLLDELGLSKDAVQKMIEAADKGPQGISLNILANELKEIQTQYAQAGSVIEIKDPSSILDKMLGLSNTVAMESNTEGKISLKDLLGVFDDYIKQKQGTDQPGNSGTQAFAKESTTAMIDKLFQSVALASDKTSVPEFSFQQVKDQFKNDLMIPDKGKNAKTGLSSQASTSSEPGVSSLLKEMEAAFSKHGNGDAAEEKKGRSENHFAPKTKTKTAQASDFSSNLVSAGKNEVDASTVRAKAPERALPSYVTHQVNKSIVRAVNQGETSLTLQLKPAHLGRLSLTIDNVNNSIKVSIITENHAAKEMLTSNLNELKTALTSAGISLDSFDVNMSSDFKQSMADTGTQAGNSNKKNSGRGKQGIDGKNLEMGDDPVLTDAGTLLDGSYHFVA